MALHGRPAMRTAVDEHMHAAILRPTDHDRRIADERGLEVARRRDLCLQRHVVPHRAPEDAFLLAVEHLLAGVDFERHPGAVGDRPDNIGGLLGHGGSSRAGRYAKSRGNEMPTRPATWTIGAAQYRMTEITCG